MVNKEIMTGFSKVYDSLYQLKMLPVHDDKFKKRIAKEAKHIMYQRSKESFNHKKAKKIIQEIRMATNEIEKTGEFKVVCKKLVLTEYFDQLKLDKTDYKKIIALKLNIND